MPRKPKPPLSLAEQMQKIINARLKLPPRENNNDDEKETDNDIGSLDQRIQKILGIVRDTKTKDNHMVFFVTS